MKTLTILSAVFALSFVCQACQQESIIGPDGGASGASACSYDYPDGPYAVRKDTTIGCLNWSANVNIGSYEDPTGKFLDLDKIFWQYQMGQYEEIRTFFGSQSTVEPKFLVFVSSAENCGACPKFMEAVSITNLDKLEDAGMVFVGTCSTHVNNDVISPETANEILEHEWPANMLRLNDTEGHIIGTMASYPFTHIISLEDMSIIEMGDANLIGSADALLQIVERYSSASK